MSQANALNSIGYTDTVPFVTPGKPDIYLLKSLEKNISSGSRNDALPMYIRETVPLSTNYYRRQFLVSLW